MVQLIKGMFNNSSPKENKEEKEDTASFQDFVKIDWYEEGRIKAQTHDGGETGLLCCVNWIYHNHKEILRKDHLEQEKAKRPYIEKRQELISQNDVKQSLIDRIKENDIPRLKTKIESIRTEISDIRRNPEQFIGNKVGKAGFIIGGLILLFLTLYLFIFYSSASFSAFFKTFSATELAEENVILKSIFDGQALMKAWNDGAQEFVFVLTIPFLFLGLGYLIHKFQEREEWTKYLKVAAVLIVTFIFDALIAYSIDKGIYEAVREGSFASPGDPDYLPPHTIQLAFMSEKFWLIIFAGFVAYVIWGLVFDFVMEAYSKLDQISIEINSRNEEIKRLESQIQEKDDEISKASQEIGNNEVEIERLRTKIDHSDIISHKELELSLMRFLNGWLEVLSFNRKPEEHKSNAQKKVMEFIEINVNTLKLEKSAQE
ncbi:MAG: hypothetical protein RI562_10635 [Salibacter sp.]|uniref:coiled-coil domain-containing protein n=1 Tax=Salibacter sp. TaxID=2010995 RepID=UPI00287059F9|nr:hypothetical protein [Salibacter sp.]MDR9399508.1 hypothetical protein [Salibacter sp.]